MTEQHQIVSDADAAARVVQLTGFEAPPATVAARLVIVTEDKTPFLWKAFIGRRAWRVDVGNVSLTLKSALPNYRDPFRRNFDVLIDEQTGQLLEITSISRGQAVDMRPEPPAEAAEAQLESEEEIYSALPEHDPKINFLTALDIVLSKGIGSPFLAKEIDGLYVMHSLMGTPARAVWVINLRGLPPRPAHGRYGDTVPVWQRNHMRNVVDAVTGEFLFATNSPQPR